MVVVGGDDDASAHRHVGPLSFRGEGFDQDLALCWREVSAMQLQDPMELIDVALFDDLGS
jgi:hypothetical protein